MAEGYAPDAPGAPAGAIAWHAAGAGGWRRNALRAGHRLLSAGTGDVAEFRGWDRLVTWQTRRTPRQKLGAVKALLTTPLRAARRAYRGVREFGPEVARHWGVSLPRQFIQLWWLGLRYGINADSYIEFQLYRPERYRRAASYLQVRELVRMCRQLIARKSAVDAKVFEDKRRFDAWCRGHGLRAVRTLVEFEGGRVTRSSLAEGTLPAHALFSKPANWRAGKGASRWTYDGRGGYVGGDGRTRQAGELLAELAATSEELKRPLIVQECLRNHSAVASLTPAGLCTMRLLTHRPLGGDVQLLLGVYRMPVGAAAADNFSQGGVAAPIDLVTGRLGQAVWRAGKLIAPLERHPDTGAAIEGHVLPFWEDAVQLALRAHRAAGAMVIVGWDIALVEDGPVLIEGNREPSSRIAQVASGIPLGETPLVRCLNEHLRECLAP